MLVNINEEIAKKYGANEAIFIQYFIDRANNLGVYHAPTFSFSVLELSEIFPFWSKDTLRRLRESLIKSHLIVQVLDDKSSCRNIKSYKIQTKNIPGGSLISNTYTCNGSFVDQEQVKSIGTFANAFENDEKSIGTFANAFESCSDYDQEIPCTISFSFSSCAGQNIPPSVMKVYRYQKKGYIIYKYIILLYNLLFSQIAAQNSASENLEQKSVKRLDQKNIYSVNNNCTLGEDKMQAKILSKNPCSPEQYMNSKFILAELNNLLVPTVRRIGFDFDANNLGPIIEQLKKGATLEDCLYVVKNKFNSWHNVPAMKNSLQPKTLFSEKHFKNYAGETVTEKDDGKNNDTRSTASSRANNTLRSWGEQIEAAEKLYGVNVFDDDGGGDQF